MQKIKSKELINIKFIILALYIGILSGCSFFVSGNFILDSNSQLPLWVENAGNLNSSDYVVEIDIYEPILWFSPKVEARVKNKKGDIIKKNTGTWELHSKSMANINKGNRAPPLWLNIKIDDTIEVYEQSQRSNILKIVNIK